MENNDQETAELPGRVKAPDDPDIRVELSENFRAELARRDPEEVARQLAKRRGGSSLHPSSITRYAQGKVAPKLSVARSLAKVLGWRLTEAVAGYSRRYRWPSLDWGRVLLYARNFRHRAVVFLELFRDLIVANTHFGFPNDRDRRWRRQVRPAKGETGYACFEVAFDEPIQVVAAPFDLVVSYCLFERPRVFIDFGKITVTPHEVRSVEVWTRRHDRAALTADAKSFWVATWVDGKAVDFIVRSRKAFTVSPTMVSEADLPPGRRALVRFKPGPMHRYDLAERNDAETAR